MITFGPQVCGDLSAGSVREWLVADGTGGYAMGTVNGLRTRRYHGLLAIAESPSRRVLAIAALDPILLLPSGTQVPLGVHEWSDGTVAPAGHVLLERFDLVEGLPRWHWRVGEIALERRVVMTHGTPGVSVTHRLLAGPACGLLVHALVTWRDSHGERRAGGELSVSHDGGGAVVDDRFRLAGPGWEPDGRWYVGVRMREEADRGLPAVEDLWSAGWFRALLDGPGAVADVRAWPLDHPEPPPGHLTLRDAQTRARDVVRAARTVDPAEEDLALAADAFVVEGPDVVAGYPWFGAWTRDTMTAFEGLFLETGRASEGRALLLRYGERLSDGMLPNTADTGTTEFNTVDATLWFVHALDRYLDRTGDTDLAATAAPWLRSVVDAHVAGTRYGIHVDADGLLLQGAEHSALTWMDVRIGDRPVTQRAGKPVEVEALWVNALAVTGAVLARTGRAHDDVERLETAARQAFDRLFTPSRSGQVPDVVDGTAHDGAHLRPNQVVAASLPHGPSVDRRWLDPVADLLTPLGLRSLHPADGAYRGTHAGGPDERDAAYHQGTVWPWLIGPYVAAAVRVGRVPSPSLLDGLRAHLGEWGLGSVSETADGAAPHRATGAPFQAWSVAEVLRAHRLLRAHEDRR